MEPSSPEEAELASFQTPTACPQSAPVAAGNHSTENSVSVDFHLQQPSSPFRGGTLDHDFRSGSTSPLSQILSSKNGTLTQADNLSDVSLQHAANRIPTMTADTDSSDSDSDTSEYRRMKPAVKHKRKSKSHSSRGIKKRKKSPFSAASSDDSSDYMDGPSPVPLRETGLIKTLSTAADATPGQSQDNTRETELDATAGPYTFQDLMALDDSLSDFQKALDLIKDQDCNSHSCSSAFCTESRENTSQIMSVQSESSSGAESDAQMEMETSLTDVKSSVTNTLPTVSAGPSPLQLKDIVARFSKEFSNLDPGSEHLEDVFFSTYSSTVNTAGSGENINDKPQPSECEAAGDSDVLVKMEAPAPAVSSSVTNTQPTRPHIQLSSDPGWSDAQIEMETSLTDVNSSVTNTLPTVSAVQSPLDLKEKSSDFDPGFEHLNYVFSGYSSTVNTEGSGEIINDKPQPSECEAAGDSDVLVKMEASVTVVSSSVSNTQPTRPHLQLSSDPGWSDAQIEMETSLTDVNSSVTNTLPTVSAVQSPLDLKEKSSDFDPGFEHLNYVFSGYSSTVNTEGSGEIINDKPQPSECEAAGDSDVLVKMEASVTVVSSSVTNTQPTHPHLQLSSDPGWSQRGSSCLPRSHSVPLLSQISCAENKTFRPSESLPDMLLKSGFEEFTPDITVDEDDDSYRFLCSCPGLQKCSVTFYKYQGCVSGEQMTPNKNKTFSEKGVNDISAPSLPSSPSSILRPHNYNRRLILRLHRHGTGPRPCTQRWKKPIRSAQSRRSTTRIKCQLFLVEVVEKENRSTPERASEHGSSSTSSPLFASDKLPNKNISRYPEHSPSSIVRANDCESSSESRKRPDRLNKLTQLKDEFDSFSHPLQQGEQSLSLVCSSETKDETVVLSASQGDTDREDPVLLVPLSEQALPADLNVLFEQLSVQPESVSAGDSDALVKMEAPVTALSSSVTNTQSTRPHLQLSSDPGWSQRGSSCLLRSSRSCSPAFYTESGENRSEIMSVQSKSASGAESNAQTEMETSLIDVKSSVTNTLPTVSAGPPTLQLKDLKVQSLAELSNSDQELQQLDDVFLSYSCTVNTAGIGENINDMPQPSECEAGGDSDSLVKMEAPVTAVSSSVTNTQPTRPHIQLSSDPGWSQRGSSCLPRSHSVPSLSQISCAENKTFRPSQSLPDMLLKSSFEEFTPDITVDEDDESYRFLCSCPGLYQCSVTGLVFHMEGEGDVVYRIVSWDRRLLAQHHKKPAGPLFDIKCLQQSVCRLHLPHCEIPSTAGCPFLSVAHLNDESIGFIPPQKITETHVIINISGFSGYGNVKDEDSPPKLVRARVLLFYRPPDDPDLESQLNVLMLPDNIVLSDVRRTRKKYIGYEIYLSNPSSCKLLPGQEYTLSTCPEDDSILVQPTTAEFYCDNYDNYFTSFEVNLEKILKHITLFLRDSNKHSVWESRVPLSSAGPKKSCRKNALNLPSKKKLLKIQSSFIERISGPSLKSLVDKLFEKKVLIDSEREFAHEMPNRGDKARFVIDTVRRKGAAASSEMIEILCKVDPFLCEDLGLIVT